MTNVDRPAVQGDGGVSALYNDNDGFACDWIEGLIAAGEITGGTVDRRSIEDLDPADLHHDRVHLFAGIGGWERALALAGWPTGRSVWTASFPCQPFSAAGGRKAFEDERHLWPAGLRLIAECRPPTIIGEQVASADGRAWLDRVRLDLEALGYAVGAADLCSAGVGAPNIRQRLFWVAQSECLGSEWQKQTQEIQDGDREKRRLLKRGGDANPGLADAERGQLQRRRGPGELGGAAPEEPRQGDQRERPGHAARDRGADGGLGHAGDEGLPPSEREELPGAGRRPQGRAVEQPSGPDGFWSAYDLIPCSDGSARRVEPGSFPLAARIPRSMGPGGTRERGLELRAARSNRVGRLKGYGNAINPVVAAEFIAAFLDTELRPAA